MLGALFEMRGYADYSTDLQASEEKLATTFEEATAFVEGCRAVVAEAWATGPDEADPTPDY